MRWLMFSVALPLILSSCECKEIKLCNIDDLTNLKNEFIQQIHSEDGDGGPYSFNYKFRTIFSSQEVNSLFGELTVHDRLPHGWKYYEGKTFCNINNRRAEISLRDLFPTDKQREFLRLICENSLKKEPVSYFSGNEPLHTSLTQDDINTFVVDDQHLIIIFQPYIVGGGADGPFFVKIPFTDLRGHWEDSHPLLSHLKKAVTSRAFTSSWDLEQFYEHLDQ